MSWLRPGLEDKGWTETKGAPQESSRVMNPALIDSALKSEGYGVSSATPPADNRASKALGAALSSLGASAGQSEEVPELRLERMQVDEYRDPGHMLSDKGVKRPAKRGVEQAMARGIRRENPIDENGVEMLRIQELTKQVQQLEAAIKARRKKGKR